jgi:beta-phosphoglucomutase-like phosphatase (HAD superfamily)
VEDSVSGLRAIRAARMRSIGIGVPEELAEGLPDCVLPSVSGLQPLLLENSNPIT